MENFLSKILGIIIVVVGAAWLIERHPGVVGLIVLVVIGAFGIRYFYDQQKIEKSRRDEEARRQPACRRTIFDACEASIRAFENIPKHLMTAEELLDTAEDEFQEGAFSPFWDSIERAMFQLGKVDEGIKVIADSSIQYKSLSGSYNGELLPFPVDLPSARRLGTINNVAGKLQKVVRVAQRDFQFATIYEQRKTNQILIAGFTNLGEAIQGVGIRLQESVEILGDQISELSSSIITSNEALLEATKSASQAANETASQATNFAARQEEANKKLDNIQRHRIPPPWADH
jgi:hypothetical protein